MVKTRRLADHARNDLINEIQQQLRMLSDDASDPGDSRIYRLGFNRCSMSICASIHSGSLRSSRVHSGSVPSTLDVRLGWRGRATRRVDLLLALDRSGGTLLSSRDMLSCTLLLHVIIASNTVTYYFVFEQGFSLAQAHERRRQYRHAAAVCQRRPRAAPPAVRRSCWATAAGPVCCAIGRTSLSGGRQQRHRHPARTDQTIPPLLLADEPDRQSRFGHQPRHIMDLFSQLNRERGITVVLVTHETGYLSLSLSLSLSHAVNRVVRVQDGRIVGTATSELARHFAKPCGYQWR